MTAPFQAMWNAEAKVFEPLRRFVPALSDEYGAGEIITLAEQHERSPASHSHYFALINEAWQSLPEILAERFLTAEHLRKYALIKAGYRDERSIVCASKAEAERVAAFIKPMDGYAVVTVSEAVVTVYEAKSQSMKAMGREQFQASKDAVLGVLASMIGVEPEKLSERAHAA